ncbi:MAG: DNA helicase II, partial [Dokdonella sp.]
LAYVGITRAREHLLLCYAETRRMHGMEMYGRPSRFLGEIPAALLKEIRPRVQASRSMPAASHASLAEQNHSLKLGQRVSHSSFGEGVVVDYEGTGAHTRVQVNFEGAGQKWLVLAYANLSAV